MSTPRPATTQPEHDPAEATRWFNQWHVYRSIVDNDRMRHRAIFSAIKNWVLLRHPVPFAVLDLGCGNAGFIHGTFTDTGVWACTGVDAYATDVSPRRCDGRRDAVGAAHRPASRSHGKGDP